MERVREGSPLLPYATLFRSRIVSLVLAPERVVSPRLVRNGCCAIAEDTSTTERNSDVKIVCRLENVRCFGGELVSMWLDSILIDVKSRLAILTSDS